MPYLRAADRTTQKTRRYFVATQDQELRNYISGVVTGVPLLYLNKGDGCVSMHQPTPVANGITSACGILVVVTLVLEPPSEKSRGSGVKVMGQTNRVLVMVITTIAITITLLLLLLYYDCSYNYAPMILLCVIICYCNHQYKHQY